MNNINCIKKIHLKFKIIGSVTYIYNRYCNKRKKRNSNSCFYVSFNLKFLFTSSKVPLKYEYYNPKNNTRYSNPNEFINTNTTNFNDSTIPILSNLPSYFF